MRQYLCIIPVLLLVACSKDSDNTPSPGNQIKYGKNRFITMVDGDEREYYVHVPANYDGKTAVPLVFMLHGTSGDGEKFYNISGWREVGEAENILTVYPSSWRYCIMTMGEKSNTTKWSSQPAEWEPCTGERLRDDIKFLRIIIDEVGIKYNLNRKKVYLAGFSNGGQMASKCSIEMGDVFAAIVQSAGSFYLNTTYQPVRKLAVTYQVGNEDYGPGNVGPEIPLTMLDSLINSPNLTIQNGRHYTITQTHVNSFRLNPRYTKTGDLNVAVTANFNSLAEDPNVKFRYILIKDLQHAYPNGQNHPYKAAEENWAWMKQFSLP